MRVVVVGAGVFGLAAALALRERGDDVALVDRGPLPHPDAATTDISKLIRADYGTDTTTTALMERALDRWDTWNTWFARPLWHPVGLRVLRSSPLTPGTFEGDSFTTLKARGFPIHREPPPPPWVGYVDGYRNERAGWAESGAVSKALLERALAAGVRRIDGAVRAIDDHAVHLATTTLGAELVVVAAGAWTPKLLPELADRIRPVGQPVLHFRPADPARWRPPGFLPWCADIADTGWYGFPANADGIVKLANHGPGIPTDPDGPREIPAGCDERFRTFLRAHLPELADAPIVGRRLCLYSDAADGDFFVDRVPDRQGVVVASGGSGHGFKFAPVLGDLVLDAILDRPSPWRDRFRWRAITEPRTEAARFDG